MSHNKHSHDDFNEHEEHHETHDNHEEEHEFFDEHEEQDFIEENDEIEEKEFTKVNDIYFPEEEKKDVDVASFFFTYKLWVFKKLFKQNTLDIKKWLNEKLTFSFKPIIKIIKITKNFDNIKKTKKNKPIYINDYSPQKDINSINLLDIENYYKESWPYSDIIKPKKNINTLLISNIKKTSNKIKKINLVKFSINFALVLAVLFCYWFYTKYKIESTISNLENLEFSSDIKKLNSDLVWIKSDLIISDLLLKPIFWLNFIIQNDNIKNLNYILSWITDLVDFWLDWVVIYDWVNNLISKKWIEEVMYSQLINNIDPIISNMDKNLSSGVWELEKVTNLWDDNLNDVFFRKLNEIKVLKNYFDIFNKNKNAFKWILWDEKKRTYLIVFQNNDEIRPTWGFMWSVWIIEVFKWKIIKFEKKDIYAIEWELKDFASKNWVAFEESAPKWLNQISEKFGLRDANYFVEISESSEKIKSFLNKANYNIDGIVYINQNIILDALNNFGWIYFDDVKREITYENFSMLISTLVEAKVSRTHTLSTPKQVLFDFSEIFFKKLKTDWNYLWYVKLFFDAIEKKDVIFYSFTPEENNILKDFWLYKVDDFTNYLDFNYPVFTSISWNKSDRYIARTFQKDITVNQDCSVNTSLNINQKHNFNITEEINIKNFLYDMDLLGKVDIKSTLEVQWKWLNKQYIRVLIPKDAIIEENSKMTITDFQNYKEVSFFLNTDTLFDSNFKINYKIQNPECRSYNFEFVKQPWIKNYQLNINKDWNLIDSVYTAKDYVLN